jgi:hypothetical protein
LKMVSSWKTIEIPLNWSRKLVLDFSFGFKINLIESRFFKMPTLVCRRTNNSNEFVHILPLSRRKVSKKWIYFEREWKCKVQEQIYYLACKENCFRAFFFFLNQRSPLID